MREGFYLWQYNGIGDMAIEIEMNGEAVVPTDARTCPPTELIGGGMTLTPLVAMTPERIAALETIIELAVWGHNASTAMGDEPPGFDIIRQLLNEVQHAD